MKVFRIPILAGLMLVLSLPCMADDSTSFNPGNVALKAKIKELDSHPEKLVKRSSGCKEWQTWSYAGCQAGYRMITVGKTSSGDQNIVTCIPE